LESFASGKDQGVDLRHSKDSSGQLVVQCKHYANSRWSNLLSALRDEIPKVARLQPKRYIVATSMQLTPRRKDTIAAMFSPYTRGPKDVLGREDLNNLLSQHPEIEGRHFKLWLASVPVLQRVLHAEIFAEQSSLIGTLERRLLRFVLNPSFGRAQDILEEHHFCLITGVPGIGKTTLAEMLIIDHLDREYECFRIWESVATARRVFAPRRRQLFYFDDFLGKTGLHLPLLRNEDERLLHFVGDVIESKNTRLILTTREYILNRAKSVMEGLGSSQLDIARCLVNLHDYTPRVRAHILYNHLYYSGTPRGHIEALIKERSYKQIVRHPNYNPRIIEAMTETLNVRDIPASEYPKAFLENLSNPRRIWEVAFGSHLTAAGQNLLLVMCSLPHRILLDDAREAFEAFHRKRVQKYGYEGTAYDFSRALKALEGNFLTTHAGQNELTVTFHNPSVRDFLEEWIRQHPQDMEDLLEFAVYNEQVSAVWGILRQVGDSPLMSKLSPSLVKRFAALMRTNPIELYSLRHSSTGQVEWRRRKYWLLDRLMTLCGLLKGIQEESAKAVVNSVLEYVATEIREGIPSRILVCEFLSQIREGEVPGVTDDHWLYKLAFEKTFAEMDSFMLDIEDYRALAEFVEDYPEAIDEAIVHRLRESFEEFSSNELDSIMAEEDIDNRLPWYDDLDTVAVLLDVDLWISKEELFGEDDWEDEDKPWTARRQQKTTDGVISDRELDAMFESLADTVG